MAKETTENKVVPAADDSTKNKNQDQTQTLEHEDNSSTVTQNGAAAKEPAEVIEAHQDGDEKDDQEQVKAETVTDTEEATEAKEETKSSKSETSEPAKLVKTEETKQTAKATEEPTKEAEPKETKTSETKITLKKADQLDEKSGNSKPAKQSGSQTRKITSDGQVNPGEKPIGEVFILVRPFVRFGRYIRDSWREIRQVRWPNRKATWKMVLAVIGYCIIFMAFLLVLDLFFTWLFNLLLNK